MIGRLLIIIIWGFEGNSVLLYCRTLEVLPAPLCTRPQGGAAGSPWECGELNFSWTDNRVSSPGLTRQTEVARYILQSREKKPETDLPLDDLGIFHHFKQIIQTLEFQRVASPYKQIMKWKLGLWGTTCLFPGADSIFSQRRYVVWPQGWICGIRTVLKIWGVWLGPEDWSQTGVFSAILEPFLRLSLL